MKIPWLASAVVPAPATSRTAQPKTAAAANRRSADDAQARMLETLKQGLERLKAVPAQVRRVTNEMSMNRLGLLRQRLAVLKELLLRATPEQARILAREIKAIAGELASTARGVARGEGAGSSASADTGPGANTATGNDASNDGAAGSMAATDTAGKDQEDTGTETEPGVTSGADDSGDAALKQALRDAAKLLKEVVRMLRAKLEHASKDDRKLLKEIEKSVADIDKAMRSWSDDSVYTNAATVTTGISVPGLSGVSIDVRA